MEFFCRPAFTSVLATSRTCWPPAAVATAAKREDAAAIAPAAAAAAAVVPLLRASRGATRQRAPRGRRLVCADLGSVLRGRLLRGYPGV